MSFPGDISQLPHLSASTHGMPIVITGTAVATSTVVHTSPAGTETHDLVTLLLCNTHSTSLDVGVVVYTGTPADPTHVVCKVAIPANAGAYVVLDGHPVASAKSVGVWCATASKITAFGKVGRLTP